MVMSRLGQEDGCADPKYRKSIEPEEGQLNDLTTSLGGMINGLSPVSKNPEARTPPANPPPGLNFERPKLSHIIKASHV